MKMNNGTFIAVVFSEDTNDAIEYYSMLNGIPNRLPPSEYHSTVVYSRKHISGVKDVRIINPEWIGIPDGLEIFESKGDDGLVKKCLVLKYHCQEIVDRHNFFRTHHTASHDFPSYIPHITLSYDIGEYDITKLNDIRNILPKIYIVREYSQELKDEDRRDEDRRDEDRRDEDRSEETA